MNLLLIINNPFIGETKMETENNKVIKINCYASRNLDQSSYGEFYSKHSEEDIKLWIESKDGNHSDPDEIFSDGVACLHWEDAFPISGEYECDISYEEHSGEVPEIDYSRYGEDFYVKHPDKFIHDEEIQKFKEELTEEEYWGTCMVCGEEICANEEQRKRKICGFCYLADDEGTK